MRTYRGLLAIVLLALLTGCATDRMCMRCRSHTPPSPYERLALSGCRVITVAELEASLPAGPLQVGFDVDDTVLFSSPGFFYGMTNTDGADGGNLYGARPLDTDAFWMTLNTKLDDFSIPKHVAFKLIDLHKARGDEIHFITARPCPSGNPDPLTRRLNALFGLENEHPVVFTNRGEKTRALHQRGIKVFYGDSDGDMRDAVAAGIRAIRVVRSPLSTNPSPTHHGAFQEEVLWNSEH